MIIGVPGHQLMKPFTNTVKHAGRKELETILRERKIPKGIILKKNF